MLHQRRSDQRQLLRWERRRKHCRLPSRAAGQLQVVQSLTAALYVENPLQQAHHELRRLLRAAGPARPCSCHSSRAAEPSCSVPTPSRRNPRSFRTPKPAPLLPPLPAARRTVFASDACCHGGCGGGGRGTRGGGGAAGGVQHKVRGGGGGQSGRHHQLVPRSVLWGLHWPLRMVLRATRGWGVRRDLHHHTRRVRVGGGVGADHPGPVQPGGELRVVRLAHHLHPRCAPFCHWEGWEGGGACCCHPGSFCLLTPPVVNFCRSMHLV